MKKIILAAILSVGAATTAVAIAEGGNKGPRGLNFEEVDTDGDGAISKAEMERQHDDRFAASDIDGDGAVSLEEFSTRVEAQRAEKAAKRQQKQFQKIDTNGDGFITADEHAAHGEKRMAKMFERVDTDGDGTISEAERDAARAKMRNKHGKGLPGGPAE